MYVCICNGIKERQVRDLARDFPDESAEQIYARLGVEPDCGSCLSYADHLISGSGFDLQDPPVPAPQGPVEFAA